MYTVKVLLSWNQCNIEMLLLQTSDQRVRILMTLVILKVIHLLKVCFHEEFFIQLCRGWQDFWLAQHHTVPPLKKMDFFRIIFWKKFIYLYFAETDHVIETSVCSNWNIELLTDKSSADECLEDSIVNWVDVTRHMCSGMWMILVCWSVKLGLYSLKTHLSVMEPPRQATRCRVCCCENL